MEETRTIQILMKLMNWSEEEVKEKLNGPAGKIFASRAEHYEKLIKNIEPDVDPLKAIDSPIEAVLDTRKDFTEQQKNDVRQGVYRFNNKVYKLR